MIRLAKPEELGVILGIYETARAFMRESGNPDQWNTTYPDEATVREDIAGSQLYVICDEEDQPHGVFAFIHGGEADYEYIEGSWHSDESYGTIHRVAGDGSVRGIVGQAAELALEHYENLRIDTHEKNIPMQKALEKQGFEKRGVIYISDGSPRWAYEYNAKKQKGELK